MIFRTGVLAKHGVEIPMDRIANINFNQSMWERVIGAGDLEIESAGRDGQSRFDNVWHPDAVQQELYRQMEIHAKKRAAWSGAAGAAAPPAASPASPSPTLPEQLQQLADLPRSGSAHRRGVRSEEGAAARAHVSRGPAPKPRPPEPRPPEPRPPEPRVVSLVPSASETLVALGVVPIACTQFCELVDVPTVGGTKRPDVRAIIDLAPDLVVVNDEENRWDDAAALIDAGLAVHSMSPRSVHDVGGEVRALAAASRSDRARTVRE